MGIDLYIYRVAKQNAINDLKMLNENSDNVLEIAYFKNDTKLKEIVKKTRFVKVY